ncbi:NAD(P)H-binding protein [Bacillus sp. Marseille-Q3570]|uniref:NAD(P)H-binding protein n=1 Tax=Bacillus sp. Marseille-Q3570 TaxID=2963522 RepID=UPI0021B72F76|nr:NAD(P)H-binding protein [Bacillus sp. Marseille-Q3570]
MTILVTGATGTVGRHLVNQLLQKGERVRALTRNPKRAMLPKEVEVVGGDLSDPDTLITAFKDVKAAHIITSGTGHVPLQTGPEIVSLASRSGVQRVTILWSGEKGSVEKAVEASNLEWTQLQPVEFMANALKWGESIRSHGAVKDMFGESLSAPIHEADIGSVSANILTSNGHSSKIYPLTGPEVLSVIDKVRIISSAIKRQIHFHQLSEKEERDRMRQMDVQDDVIDYVINWHANPPTAAYTVVPTVKEVTGQPPKSFAEWVLENKKEFL